MRNLNVFEARLVDLLSMAAKRATEVISQGLKPYAMLSASLGL